MKKTWMAVLFACAALTVGAGTTYEELWNGAASALTWPEAAYAATYAANLSASAPASAASDPFVAAWAAFFGETVGAGFGTAVMSRQSGVCPALDCAFRPGALLLIR